MNLGVKCGTMIKQFKRTKIQQKNRKSDIQLQNGGKKKKKKNNIKFPTKNGKTTFPKEFFLEIWLIIEN